MPSTSSSYHQVFKPPAWIMRIANVMKNGITSPMYPICRTILLSKGKLFIQSEDIIRLCTKGAAEKINMLKKIHQDNIYIELEINLKIALKYLFIKHPPSTLL